MLSLCVLSYQESGNVWQIYEQAVEMPKASHEIFFIEKRKDSYVF
jgi:hypothetical protein